MFLKPEASFSILAAAAFAILAGCASGGSGVTAPGSAVVPMQSVAGAASLRRASSGTVRAFVDSAAIAHATKMIAVSDEEQNGLTVYDPSGRVLAVLSGSSSPEGLASDPKGDLYVADTSNSQILVYPPDLKGQPATLSDPGQFPDSVAAFDNGKVVAAVNELTTGYGPGGITVYTGGVAGAPITSPLISRAYFAAFDASGNLYVSVTPTSGNCPCIAEIVNAAKGGTKFRLLKTSISVGGGVQVTNNGKIAINDGSEVYTFNPPVHGSLGSPVAKTVLGSVSSSGAFAFTQDMKDLYVLNYNDNGYAAEFAYPSGRSVSSFEVNGYPFAIAVFPAQSPRGK